MKLSVYTLDQVEREIKEELFRIWKSSKLNDWTNTDMRDLYLLYRNLFDGDNK